MAQTYNNSRVNPVYYRVGKFQGSQASRFIRAPFETVAINGNLYLHPTSQSFSNAALAQLSNADAEQVQLSRQPAGMYTDLAIVVVEEQEMGCKDDAVSWKGMHRFGWI